MGNTISSFKWRKILIYIMKNIHLQYFIIGLTLEACTGAKKHYYQI